ncbi:MAG TPA: energy transducer TonB [Longimicrobium sp.]|nr:energy transducer TonB [Longimicrobium sp.]
MCALVLVLGACGTAGRQAGTPAPTEVRQTRACRPEEFPAHLPAVAALVDTGVLTPALRQLRDSAGVAGGEVVLSLWYEPDGVNIRRDVVQHSVSPLVADSVQELVFAALSQAPEMEAPWGARLRVGLAGEVSYAVGRREFCPPRPRSSTLEGEMAGYMGTGVRYRGGAPERTVLMQVTVHPGGFVEDARVLRGAPAGGTLEKQLRDMVRVYSFYPAVLDGVPVRGEIAVPLRVRG